MFAIKEKLKSINGKKVDTYEREVVETGTVLLVEAGTTGYKGGSVREPGCRTYISIESLCGNFHFTPVLDEDGNTLGIDIVCCGDAGLDAIMKAFDFIQKVINDQLCGIDD